MNERGYGRTQCFGIPYRAHRVAWEMENGPIPNGMIVRHLCDNPRCCNPKHLTIGTHADNMADASERGRMPRGRRHRLAKLSDDAVRVIRASSASVSALARAFGVDRKTIRQARDGKRWRHVS